MSAYEPSRDAINKGRNLAVDRVTLEVFEALDERHVDAILLKGPTHARWLYDPEHRRTYSDTDLLVVPDSLAAVEEALTALGFELPPIYSDIERPGYEHAWVRRGDGVRVDVHWSLIGVGVEPEVTWNVLAGERMPFDLRGRKVTALSLQGRALHVALHAAQHGEELGSAMEDLTRAVEHRDVWPGAAALAERLHAVDSLAAGLRLDPVGAEIADGLGLPVELPFDIALRAQAPPPHSLSLQWFLAQRGTGRKLRLILGNLFPPAGFMREWSPLARRGLPGLVLAYLWRPFHLVGRLVVAALGLRRARRNARG